MYPGGCNFREKAASALREDQTRFCGASEGGTVSLSLGGREEARCQGEEDPDGSLKEVVVEVGLP